MDQQGNIYSREIGEELEPGSVPLSSTEAANARELNRLERLIELAEGRLAKAASKQSRGAARNNLRVEKRREKSKAARIARKKNRK